MIKILRLTWVFLIFVFFLFFFSGQAVLAWSEDQTNPIYDPVVTAEKAYFPSVLKIGANDYRMWYQSNSTQTNSTIAYAISSDGLTWTIVTNNVSGLIPNNSGHPHVEFTDGKFRIWYWNTITPYDNVAMHYAESIDGITWTNDSVITGNLITATGGQWNSGSYGAADVIINDSPTNIGSNPFDYRYAMYYDATSGGYEQIALWYSADGINWTLYGTEPVISRGVIGSWDSGYVTAATVIKGDIWEMWYSGGISASNEGIGYATSIDGIIWTKSATNPFIHKNDGVAWRNSRTYTPSVIKDGGFYKMWFTGRDTTTSNYTIGYATLPTQSLPTPEPITASSPINSRNYNTLTVLEQVTNDSGGTATFNDFSLFINGNPVQSGKSIDLAPGVYTITETNLQGYTLNFTGNCDANGKIVLGGFNTHNAICTIVNNDIGMPPVAIIPPPY